MFDSPFDYCPVCKEMVLLDQTKRECGNEHHCASDVSCPLERCFSGFDFSCNQMNRISNERPA
ncbi:MAG: hypothetical protein NTX56_11325 [Proteobacteria bacterium]|nr:hypothetical protein [Pseudomonadota bacterium]